jgi:uncharacterized protein (TIGR00251 family)
VADDAILSVRVTARAGRNALGEMVDGVLAVRLAAPPVDGAANKALVAFLAEAFGIPKSDIRIEAGQQSRRKRLRISGLAPDDLAGRLARGGD